MPPNVDVSLFDFDLPEDRIASEPAAERDLSRLMLVDRGGRAPPEHRVFRDLPSLLRPGDLLVLNETAVFNARLLGRRSATGGKVEVLLLEERGGGAFDALVRSKSAPRGGEALRVGEGDAAFDLVFEASRGEGRARVRFPEGQDPWALVDRAGLPPLPPYIRRERRDPRTESDRRRYQTVFARERGSVAAPTAGLHFTEALLDRVRERGVGVARLTLHVGLGTFAPVRSATVEDHVMHLERYSISQETVAAVAAAKREGRRVVACGTTSLRALESWALAGVASGSTDLFIHEGFGFRVVDALVTNFHLPRSTLLMLVSAFAGRENVLAAYGEAIARGYRFYSYGDAMLVEDRGEAARGTREMQRDPKAIA